MSHPIPPPPISVPISAPPRSTTAPSSQSSQHHHHIHRPHRSHHHHHHHRDKSVPQSAILPTSSNPFKDNSLGDLLSPITKVGSRLEHLNRHEKENEEGTAVEDEEALRRKEKAREEKERETWKEVEKRRRRRVEGEQDLNKKLTALSTLSTDMTRRLDYTHYSLLSHVSSLVSILSALSSLSSSASEHLDTFGRSTNEYARTAQGQLSQFDKLTFAAKKERAEGLERRVKNARTSVEMLEKRLSVVREKVEGEENGERERGRRIQWRWRCMVGTFAAILGVLVLGGIARFGEREVGGWGTELTPESGQWEPGGSASPHIGDVNTTILADEPTRSEIRIPQTTKTASARGVNEWEPRLRMLEEL